MEVSSAVAMFDFGREFSAKISAPAVIELIGDVGAGKTTFTQGLASGLGISAPLTSPSFTISKRYPLPTGGELIHYDFYRLVDAGIMADELAEAISAPENIILLEWADTVGDILPSTSIKLKFTILPSGARKVEEIK